MMRASGIVKTLLAVAALVLLPATASSQEADEKLPGEMMYPTSSTVAWDHVQALLKELRFGSQKTDRKHQVLITGWRDYDTRLMPEVGSLGFAPGMKPVRIQLHILVAPRPQPARVAVGSVMEVRSQGRQGERTSYVYRTAAIEGWFLDRLAARIGASGVPLSPDWGRRIEQAKQLLPPGVSDECLFGLPDFKEGQAKPPVRTSQVEPVFPAEGFSSGEGSVVVAGWMTEHGTMTRLQVTNPRPDLAHYETSARAAVGLWRFEPPVSNGCPVSAFLTVTVRYRMR